MLQNQIEVKPVELIDGVAESCNWLREDGHKSTVGYRNMHDQ
jgi:hypothetical protein